MNQRGFVFFSTLTVDSIWFNFGAFTARTTNHSLDFRNQICSIDTSKKVTFSRTQAKKCWKEARRKRGAITITTN